MTLIETEEQTLLRDMLRRYLADAPSPADGPGAVWQGLADLGVLALPMAESAGGSGCGMAELAVAMSELGRALRPEPFVACVVQGAGLIEASPVAAGLLTEVGAGRLVLALADGLSGPGQVTATGDRLRGSVPQVAGGAGRLVVAARDAADVPGLWLVEAGGPGVVLAPVTGPDGIVRAALRLDDAPGLLLSAGDGVKAELAAVQDRATICHLAEALGVMDAVLEMTVAHLTTRHQFGRPLAACQVLQHRAAEMFVELELARSMLAHAVAVEGAGPDAADRAAAVAVAQLRICRAIRHLGPEAIQLHGGMGMAWETRVGHLFKRALAIDLMLGGEGAALDRLTATPAPVLMD